MPVRYGQLDMKLTLSATCGLRANLRSTHCVGGERNDGCGVLKIAEIRRHVAQSDCLSVLLLLFLLLMSSS